MKAVPAVLVACGLLLPGVLLLSGCTGSGSPAAQGGSTPAPTVTVTATPSAPPRNPSDRLTTLDAWIACAATAKKSYDYDMQVTGTKWEPYAADLVKPQPDGTYKVTVNFQPKGAPSGSQATCTVGGTIANPVIVDFAFADLG